MVKSFKIRKVTSFFVLLFIIVLFLFHKNIVIETFLGLIFLFSIIYLLIIKVDYLKPSFALGIPYIFLLLIALIPIGYYHRDIDINTINLIIIIIIISLLYSFSNIKTRVAPQTLSNRMDKIQKRVLHNNYLLTIGFFYMLTILNIILAGYIPLVNGLLYGDSEYYAFGISGLYGFYLAFANFLAIFSYYAYLKTKSKIYLHVYISIIFILILFVTRLNIFSILIESMVIHNHIEKRIKFSKLLLYGIIFSICFSFIGETVRGTDIKDLARINDEFLWLPTSIIWVYAYSYFNILNLDNLINSGMYPAYDGSAFAELIPNIFRPDFGHPRLLELGNFNVSPYIAPIYRDLGFLGCIIFTIIILYVSNYFYKKSLTENSFLYIGSFSVLYFCSIMSFFKNFWFFLPIIFQLFFIFFGSALLISKKSLHI